MAEGLVWMAAPILLVLGAVGAVGPGPTPLNVPTYGATGNTEEDGILWEDLPNVRPCYSNTPGILYKVVAPADGQMTAHVGLPSRSVGRVQVYHGDSPDTATCVATGDWLWFRNTLKLEWEATKDESYLILVNGDPAFTYIFSVYQFQEYALGEGNKLPEVINKAALHRQKLSIPSHRTLVLSLGLVALFGFATLTAVVVRRRIDRSRSEAIPLQSAEE